MRHADEHVEKILAGDVAGATARCQDSARFQQSNRQTVQPMVGAEGFVDRLATAANFGGSRIRPPKRWPASINCCMP